MHPIISFPEFNLSRLKALRSLQVAAWVGVFSRRNQRHAAVTRVFMTITSPMLSELVIVISGYDMTYLPREVGLFDALREMNEFKPFKLVFLPEGSSFGRETARQKFTEALDSVTARGFFKFLALPPTIRWGRFSSP